jgi:hypothetical protein
VPGGISGDLADPAADLRTHRAAADQAGRDAGTPVRGSLRLRLAGPDSLALEERIAAALRDGPVDEAYLVESETDEGAHLLLGLVGGEGASATVDVPAGTDLVWLEEPMLSSVRRVARPFYRRGRR